MESQNLTALEVERFFCLALLCEGTDVAARVLTRFVDYRNNKDNVLSQLSGLGASSVNGNSTADYREDDIPF